MRKARAFCVMLFADRTSSLRNELESHLPGVGYNTTVTDDIDFALEMLESADAVIIDVARSGRNGHKSQAAGARLLTHILGQQGGQPPIGVIVSRLTEEKCSQMGRLGIAGLFDAAEGIELPIKWIEGCRSFRDRVPHHRPN
jgi:CheY-like chemotaxis protein